MGASPDPIILQKIPTQKFEFSLLGFTEKEVEVCAVEEEEQEEAPPPPPMFSEEEMNARIEQARKEAHEKGFQEGRDAAQAAIDQEKTERDMLHNQLLEQLIPQYRLLEESLQKWTTQGERDWLALLQHVLRRFCSQLAPEEHSARIMGLAEECLRQCRSQPELTFRIHPDMETLLTEDLKKLAQESGFSGRLSIETSDRLTPADVRIQWPSGTAEHRPEDILEQISAILQGAAPAAPDEPSSPEDQETVADTPTQNAQAVPPESIASSPEPLNDTPSPHTIQGDQE